MSDADLADYAGTWRRGRRLAASLPGRYVVGGSLWAAHHVLPLFTGLVLQRLFDGVSTGSAAGDGALALVAVYVAMEVVKAVEFYAAIVVWPLWWHTAAALLRTNVLRSVLKDRVPPAVRVPGSAAEATGRFREDVFDVVWFVDIWVDVTGGLVFTVAALSIMARIDALITAVVVVPMVAVVLTTRLLSRRIRRYHEQTRAAGASVGGLIGEVLSNVLALKAAGTEAPAMRRLRTMNAARVRSAVKAEMTANLVPSISDVAVELAIGLVLLLSAARMRRGEFSVGDLTLFTTYAAALTGLPRWTARMLALHRAAAVSMRRLARLVPDADEDVVVAPPPVDHPIRLRDRVPAAGTARRRVEDPEPPPVLERLEVRDLVVRHPGSGKGVLGVDLDVRGGSFTVVTGAVGSGKTTLVRGLLGLLPIESGTIRWNGEEVDPGSTMVPPRVAYAGQVPRLLSASLEDNVVLGWPARASDVDDALATAVLDTDLAELDEGLATLVGPRGVRLSGGQIQRVTAARALVRRPALLVVDDVSSALDVETEQRLWQRIAARPGGTTLVVSHRRAALTRADHVVVLDRGVVCAAGPLDVLLRDAPEMRRLWREELFVESEERLGG